MPRRAKLSPDSTAIIEAIANATSVAKTVSDKVAEELHTHTLQDDKRFADLTKLVESIATDVKSLINSRQFFRGAWWAVVGMAGILGAGIAAIWHYFHG